MVESDVRKHAPSLDQVYLHIYIYICRHIYRWREDAMYIYMYRVCVVCMIMRNARDRLTNAAF